MATENGMIEPFADRQTKTREDGLRVISYGLSSYGYDLRVSREFKVFTNVFNTVSVWIQRASTPSHSSISRRMFVLCLPIPSRLRAVSSISAFLVTSLRFAWENLPMRAAVFIVNVTPFEPEWEGHVTLEISNTTPLPAKIYANEGLAQVVFFLANEVCETSYADRAGKYMRQTGITIPRM